MNPKVIKVKPLKKYKLLVHFDNEEQRIMDMMPLMYGVFARLEEPDYFRRVRVVRGCIEWPHGQDLSNDTVYLESKPAEENIASA